MRQQKINYNYCLIFILLISVHIFFPDIVLAYIPTDDPPITVPLHTSNAPAQSDKQLGCGGGFGPFADVFCGGDFSLGNIFNNAVSKILGFLTIIAALYFFFQFVTAGIQWIGSGGDKNNIEQARNKMINAIIGLVIVAAAWVIVGIIGMFVGINIINPGSLLNTLQLHPGTTQ